MAYAFASTSPARIEWELLPSLRNLLPTRRTRGQARWADTVPSDFEAPLISGPFEEPLPGLQMRELCEPDFFEIFFG